MFEKNTRILCKPLYKVTNLWGETGVKFSTFWVDK